MKSVKRFELICLFLLATAFVVSALFLIDTQYKTRKAFIEQERELMISRRLLDDEAELQMKVRRASLTGAITDAATELGLKGASGDNTVILVKESDGSIRLSKNTQKQLEEAELMSQSHKDKKK